ncbi:MAG: hypothetical protein SF097_17900 [Acidobacteriota bacterium]|nr:hypothetical protein [Acidobacteriota bacterium]
MAPQQKQPIYLPSSFEALRQGEIISNLLQPKLRIDTLFSSEPTIKFEKHPFAIIVTQDCDLEQDFKARQFQKASDKLLPSILFCQLTSATDMRGRDEMGSDIWKRVKINKDERYHFFQKVKPEEDLLGEGLPELGADFKRYFAMPTEEVYERLKSEAQRRCTFASPYLEHFCTRFAYYQFRIALPEDHFSEPVIQ